LKIGGRGSTIAPVETHLAPNLRELQRYLGRVGDRWPLRLVILGGARVADLRDPYRQLEPPGSPLRGPEYAVLLVSESFDGMPWLERVYQASSLWDALEMGGSAELHCYTTAEYRWRRESTPAVRAIAESGLLLFEDTGTVQARTVTDAADQPATRRYLLREP
jgi:hypothetical protein